MSRPERLKALIQSLGTGPARTAAELAARFGVTERTIYRDMDRLRAEGVPLAGTPGQGYRLTATFALPPLALSARELEALHLGLSIVGEAGDAGLAAAAASLSARIDGALSEDAGTAGARWGFTPTPTGTAAEYLRFLPTLRAALRARQKIALRLRDGSEHQMRLLALEYHGRLWICGGWCEECRAFHRVRLDEISDHRLLTALFVDEPGRDLAAYRAAV